MSTGLIPPPRIALGACAFGRAIDAAGMPLDGGKPLNGRRVALELRSPLPAERVAIDTPLWTGVRAIDALLTFGRGARIGIFGAPGSGKTTLIEAIVDGCEADAVVVALVGERGREAQGWIARCDARTTVVCATSDRPAQERVDAALVAVAQARALRERSLHVLFVLDSLARAAAALRELSAARGEATGRAGYAPSVFAELARLVEPAGAIAGGSITLVATVLSDGDERDPVSEAARSLLDGHVELSRALAREGRFPAIDALASTSRTMERVVTAEHANAARNLRRVLALLARTEDARSLGIVPKDPAAVAALGVEPRIEQFLRQYDPTPATQTLVWLTEVAREIESSDGNR